MAEHDDIVRQAAEAAAKACLRNPGAVYVSDVAGLLSPFFAAARKEARAAEHEAVLEEAIKAVNLSPGDHYRDEEDIEEERICGFQDGIDAAYNRLVLALQHARALRSKPEEPA